MLKQFTQEGMPEEDTKAQPLENAANTNLVAGTAKKSAAEAKLAEVKTGSNNGQKSQVPVLYSPAEFNNVTLNERFHRLFRQLGVVPSLAEPLVIGVTSSVRGEGRTLTALGLATAISEQVPLPILLLETDLTQPSLATDLGLPNQGLCEYLRNEMELDDLIQSTALPDLSVILAGDCKNEALKTLRSERLSSLFSILSQQFAAIVVDLPPISLTAESTRMISQVDHVLMVVQAGSTPAKLVKAAQEFIPQEKRMGVVLNRARRPLGPLARLGKLIGKVF